MRTTRAKINPDYAVAARVHVGLYLYTVEQDTNFETVRILQQHYSVSGKK